MDDIQKVSDKIKRQLENLENETLELIYQDHAKAVEYVKKGFNSITVEELNNKSIEDIAHEMQAVARMLLNERE